MYNNISTYHFLSVTDEEKQSADGTVSSYFLLFVPLCTAT